MLSGLVDNSTLTAVQRVIGDVPVAYSFPIEGDLAAFDQYLQALLIYDEVAALDDYKDEFKAGRHERFKEVRFLNPDNIPYSNASAYASKALEGLQFQIRKGKVATGPLSDFLSSLNLHVSPAWYMQSSDWFLNVRLLADESGLTLEKYSALMSMIQAEGIEANQSSTDLSQRLLIEGSDGEKIDTTSRGHRTVGDDVKQFAQSLNWMAHRAVFYLYLSSELSSALVTHPIRHSYLGKYIISNVISDIPPNARSALLDFFTSEVVKIRNSSDRMIGNSVFLELPFFAAWATGYAGNPRNGYDHVLQVRNSSPAQQLRKRFRDIEAAMADQEATNRRDIARMYSALSDDIKKLSVKFEGSKPNPGLGFSVNILSLSPSVSVPNAVDRVRTAFSRKNHNSLTLLRNIASDFSALPTMGKLRDYMNRSRRYAKGTPYIAERPRIEPSRFRLSSTWFKEPL